MTLSTTALSAQAKIFAVQCIISSTAAWRDLTATKFPNDLRNARAAALLRALASESVEHLPEELVAKVATFPSLSRPARDVAEGVGFRRFPESFAAFLEEVIEHAGGIFSKSEGGR
jgi:hypothetical protein